MISIFGSSSDPSLIRIILATCYTIIALQGLAGCGEKPVLSTPPPEAVLLEGPPTSPTAPTPETTAPAAPQALVAPASLPAHIRIALHHEMSYRYSRPVTLLPQLMRLRPAPHCRTPILSYALKVNTIPNPEQSNNWRHDSQGNWLACYQFPNPVSTLNIIVDLEIEMAASDFFDVTALPTAGKYPVIYAEEMTEELAPFRVIEAFGPQFSLYLEKTRSSLKPGMANVDVVTQVNRQINTDINYIKRMEPGVQTPEVTLDKASGSCRDSSWLLVHLLRHLGFASRFTSGYLVQLASDQQSPESQTDFVDLHAWCEVYLPGAGWIGLDPTSGLLVGDGHIPLACTPEPASAAILSGALNCEVDERYPLKTDLNVVMTVTRVPDQPDVTKPHIGP